MAFRVNIDARGVAELVLDNPPVNALGRAAGSHLAASSKRWAATSACASC